MDETGEEGLGIEELASKTCCEVSILARLMRHATALKFVRFSYGKVHATTLSNGLGA